MTGYKNSASGCFTFLCCALFSCSADRNRDKAKAKESSEVKTTIESQSVIPAAEKAEASVLTPDPKSTVLYQSCLNGAVPSVIKSASISSVLSNAKNKLIKNLGDPEHYARDVLAVSGDAKNIVLEAYFAYGDVFKDLENVPVDIYADTCNGAAVLIGSQKTSDEGAIRLEIAPNTLPLVGIFRMTYVLKEQGEQVHSYVEIVPKGTQMMVFDIDGTLTTGDKELFKDLLIPKQDTDMRMDGDNVVAVRNKQGYKIVFLTSRPSKLGRYTRDWLKKKGFSEHGIFFVSNKDQEVLPTIEGSGAFKKAALSSWKNSGLKFPIAYGNTSTDIYAYHAIGIPEINILGPEGGKDGTISLGDDYKAHLEKIANVPPIDQPFRTD